MAHNPRSGQSLIDVLIASGVGAILLVGALAVLTPALRGSSDAEMAQMGAALARGLADSTRSLASSDWDAVASLPQGTNNPHYLTYSATGSTPVAGTESVVTGSGTFMRSFYLEPVRRNSTGAIVLSGGNVDASTLQMVVRYQWPRGAARLAPTFLTRSRTNAFTQGDWTGGGGFTTATTTPGNRYGTSTSNITVDLVPGSFKLNL